ncbi:MAG: hypothetical protein R3C03_21165 [Pirellulaceae bacterium]
MSLQRQLSGFAFSILVISFVGCEGPKPTTEESASITETAGKGATGESIDSPEPIPTEPAKEEEIPWPQVGDTVVAAWTGTQFYEAQVSAISDESVSIKWTDSQTDNERPLIDLIRLPTPGVNPVAKIGDIVLVRRGEGAYWEGAVLQAMEGDAWAYQLTGSEAKGTIAPDRLIACPDRFADNLRLEAEKTQAVATFRALVKGLRPEVPEDYTPENEQLVVAEWTFDSWWEGTITSMDDENVTVAWADGSQPTPIAKGKIAPLPADDSTYELKADQLVLVKPEYGSQWNAAKIVSIDADAVEIELANRDRRTVKNVECIPLRSKE